MLHNFFRERQTHNTTLTSIGEFEARVRLLETDHLLVTMRILFRSTPTLDCSRHFYLG